MMNRAMNIMGNIWSPTRAIDSRKASDHPQSSFVKTGYGRFFSGVVFIRFDSAGCSVCRISAVSADCFVLSVYLMPDIGCVSSSRFYSLRVR